MTATPVDLPGLARQVEMLRNHVLGLTCLVAALPDTGPWTPPGCGPASWS